MPTLQVSRTYNIQKSIDYVTSEKAHYNHEQTEGKRVQWASGVNYKKNMEKTKVMYKAILSFKGLVLMR